MIDPQTNLNEAIELGKSGDATVQAHEQHQAELLAWIAEGQRLTAIHGEMLVELKKKQAAWASIIAKLQAQADATEETEPVDPADFWKHQ